MSVATDELTLLERVFLRIGSADTDEQLQNAVSKFLPPVLLKLSSQQEGVRKKVMELLVHINKRIKSRPNVQLPVESLLLQYEDPSASSFIINFTIIYIKIGFPRLPVEKQAELMPIVLNALEGKPESHQDSLLLLLMPVLSHVKFPNDVEKRSSMFGLNERPKITKLLSDFMLDMLLLPYGASVQQSENKAPDQPGSSGGTAPPSFPIPPGLSEQAFKRVTGENPLKPEDLEQVKLGIVKFLAGGILRDSDILIHLIVAAADTRFNVANFADMELKKIINGLDWSSYHLVAPLYRVFLGTEKIQKSDPAKNDQQRPINQKNIRSPASTRIRLKLLTYLPLSRQYDYMLAQPIQVIFESLFGNNTNPRLKVLALQFALQVINGANLLRLKPVAAILLSGMVRLITETDPALKRLAYTAIGKLAYRVPKLVNRDLGLVQSFFDSLHSEGPDIKLSIREALLSMAPAFGFDVESEAKITDNLRMLMVALLASQIESSEPMARFIAVRYCATVFPTTHVPSRYLLLLAAGDNKDEVFTEAVKALYGTNRRFVQGLELDSLLLPSFVEMTIYLEEKAASRLSNPMQRFTINNKTLPFSVATFTEMVTYLRMCLSKSAGAMNVEGSPGDQLPGKMTPLISLYIRQLHSSEDGNNALCLYISFSEKLLMATQSIISLTAILEIVGCVPDLVASTFIDKLPWIKVLITSTKEEIRELAAMLYGFVLANALSEPLYNEAVRELCQATTDKNFEIKHGSILALAHCLERKFVILKKNNANINEFPNWDLYNEAINFILSAFKLQQVQIVNASCFAIGQMAKIAPLPLINENDNLSKEEISKRDLVIQFQEMINSPKTNIKTRELAAKTIGFLCVGENFPHSDKIIEGFLKMAKETKDVEIQLTCGESLVLCVEGPRSSIARDAWTISEADWQNSRPPPNQFQLDTLAKLLDHLLDQIVPQPHPNSRQASCIWLLALLKYCASYTSLIERLGRIQRAFMDLLAENNDIVQDAASKGLSLVYEASDERLRGNLVNELLDQLMAGRRQVSQVTSETKIFEENTLGKTPTGGNLSTYKELCSLASDLNQPDLIYKFMHLANHNAIWNSKKGAAFGFSTIARTAGEQLTQHLPKIIPRLYRYQFDPTPKIQNSMTSIWHGLVTETQKTLDLYHREILEELAQHLTANEWRVRTSCCSALSDLLKSGGQRSLTDPSVLPIVPRLWTQLFRVMDDVHEGTRKAAEGTCQVLSKVCLRYSDPVHGANSSEQMLHAILPVLLEVGITNQVAKVRAISLQTISQLVGISGKLLQPHMQLLVPALLEATGELESAKLSQLSTMYSADQSTQEAIDVARASAAKSHYTTETVSKCMQFIQADNLELLIPKVLELMRNSVGLGTKIACAHFIVLLTHHLKQDLKPYTGKLLAALVNGLTDRNAAIRRHYASTIGQLVSTAKDSSLEKLFSKITTWYFEKEDELTRTSCALTLRAIAEHNQDLLREHSAQVAPLAFFAQHEGKSLAQSSSTPTATGTTNAELWSEVWDEVTHSTDSSFRQHGNEIVATLERAIDSASWTMKAQAAASIATIAKKLGGSLEPQLRDRMLQLLLKSLVGRTWNGKEQLLLALAMIATSCKKDLCKPENQEINTNLVDALLHECKKEQLAYKHHALQALGDVLSALNIDRFAEVYSLVQDALSKNLEDSDSDKENIEAFNKLKGTVYEVLGKAWPSNHETQVLYRERVLEQCVTCLEQSTRQVQVSVVVALRSYVDKLTLLKIEPEALVDSQETQALQRILLEITKALNFALGISKHTSLRKEALNVLFLLITKLKESKQEKYIDDLSKSFDKKLEDLYSDTSPEIKSRLVDIKDLLKS